MPDITMKVSQHSRRSRLAVAAALLSLVFTATSPLALGIPPARAAKTWSVSIYGDDMTQEYGLIPANLTINVGDTANWTSTVGTHATTPAPSQSEWWDSGMLAPGNYSPIRSP